MSHPHRNRRGVGYAHRPSRSALRRARGGITLVELVFAIVAAVGVVFFLAVFAPSCRRREQPPHYSCMANLNGIGKACVVYQGEYDDQWPWLIGTGWEDVPTGWNRASEPATGRKRSVTALPFLLVRIGHSPAMFTCPSDEDVERDDRPRNRRTGRWNWDFNSHKNISFSWQAPRIDPNGRAVNGISNKTDGSVVIVADKTPTYHGGSPVVNWGGKLTRQECRNALSRNHDNGERIHVLFAGFNVGKFDRGDCGFNGDNIYTAGGPSPRGRLGLAHHTDPDDSYLIGPFR